MLDAKIVLEYIAAAFGSLFALFEVLSLRRKLKAESRLVKLLLVNMETRMGDATWRIRQRPKIEKDAWEYNQLMMYMLANRWADPEILEEVAQEIDTALKQLSESDRQAILEGLRQPSEIGRGDYIKKLLAKALTKLSIRLSPS